jgi:hypothetical protein
LGNIHKFCATNRLLLKIRSLFTILFFCLVNVYHFYATASSLFTISVLLSGYCLPFYATALSLFKMYMLLSGYCLPFYATALPLFKIYMLMSGYCLPFCATALLLFEALPLLLIISHLKPHFLFRSPFKISELVPLYLPFETRPVFAVSVLCT